MTPEARAFILRLFCRSVTAVEAAYLVNEIHDLDVKITAPTIRKIWDDEREANPVLRSLEEEFGERPMRGFVQCEHTRLAEQLVAV